MVGRRWDGGGREGVVCPLGPPGVILAQWPEPRTEGGLWWLDGAWGDGRGHGGSVLVVGGPAKPLVGLVGLLSCSGLPLPSIFHC
eukprot:SAG31_NODE_12597_length_930_cov_4.223827_2_plen_85_part_00